MKYNNNNVHQSFFDHEAQSYADSFWMHLSLSGLICYLWGWWCLIPALLALVSIQKSVIASKNAELLRLGKWPYENPNNGLNPPNESVCKFQGTLVVLLIWLLIWLNK